MNSNERAASPVPFVLVCGQLTEVSQPAIRADDRGFTYGDGAFESLRAVDGVPIGLGRHRARLLMTLDFLGIPSNCIGRAEIQAQQIRHLLHANGISSGEAHVRICVSRGPSHGPRPPACPRPTVVVYGAPLGELMRRRRRGVHGVTVCLPNRAYAAFKTLSYLPSVLALLRTEPSRVGNAHSAEPRQAGAQSENHQEQEVDMEDIDDRPTSHTSNTSIDPPQEIDHRLVEPFFVSPTGGILEGATCNLFAIHGNTVVTPPADGSLLPGIAREICLTHASALGMAICERPIYEETLAAADEVLVTNAVLRAAPLLSMDGVPLPTGRSTHLRSLLPVFDQIADQ